MYVTFIDGFFTMFYPFVILVIRVFTGMSHLIESSGLRLYVSGKMDFIPYFLMLAEIREIFCTSQCQNNNVRVYQQCNNLIL